nr:MAG TPA: hypothetical protein [Caudoviricetes sp.]
MITPPIRLSFIMWRYPPDTIEFGWLGMNGNRGQI